MSEIRIFQPTDLRRDRAFVDAARDQGRAHLRDTDGVALVLVREQELSALERNGRRMRSLGSADTAVVDLLINGCVPDAWPWLAVFDVEDRTEFGREVVDALRIDWNDEDADEVGSVLSAWRETAAAIRDSERYEALTQPIRLDHDTLDVASHER